jgi:hypothetical protein
MAWCLSLKGRGEIQNWQPGIIAGFALLVSALAGIFYQGQHAP